MNVPRRKIYLAGGFSSGWQETAKSKLNKFECLDPGAHGIKDPLEYTRWDLAALRDSEIVLANMEASNPGGYALALEVGFAKALGKQIYLVDQIEDPSISHYFEMVRQCSDRVFKTLEESIEHITAMKNK